MALLTLIKFRRGTAATWTSANPTLGLGEPGFESDTNFLKIGDGVTAWTTLPYFTGGGLSSTLTSAHLYIGNGSNVATDTAVTGDVTISNTGVTAIGANKVTNAQLAQAATLTLKGNNTGGTANVSDLTASQAKTLLAIANTDVSGLGTMSTQDANNVAITGGTITGMPTPSGGSDVATKSYVDASTSGLSPKDSVVAVSVSNEVGTYANGASGVGATITYTATGDIVVDGVTLVLNDRVLLTGQTSALENGIYYVSTAGGIATQGVLTRATDYDESSEIVAGTYTLSEEGSARQGTLWIMTATGTLTIGTDAITFTELAVAPQTLTLTSDVTGTGAGSVATTVAKIQGTTVSGTTGTTNVVFSNSPTLVTPALGTPSSATLTNATGLPISTGVSGLGANVATFLATPSSANLASAVTDETGTGALVFATSPTLVTPALGTPSSATLTNATGLPITTGVSGLGANVATFLATPSSANLAAAVTDETGTGALVFAVSPVFTTPNIGSATGSITGNAGTATALQTARTINGTSFDGTADIVISTVDGGTP